MRILLTTTCLLLYILLPLSAQDNRDVFAEGKANYQQGAYYEAYQRFSAAYTLSKNSGDAAYQDLSRIWIEKSAAGIRAVQQRTDSLLQATRKLMDAFYFYEDRLALAYKDEKFGFINKRGEVVIDYQYSSATNFDEATGYAQVEKEDKKRYWLAPNGMEYPYTTAVEDLPTVTLEDTPSFPEETKNTPTQSSLEDIEVNGSKDYHQALRDGIDRYQQGDYFASFQRFNAANVLAENDNNGRIADWGSRLRDSAVQRIRLLAVQSANALEVAQNIREAFYFYEGKYALASGEKKSNKVFYYIDKNGEEFQELGHWAKVEQFDYSGFAKVVDDEGVNYLLDTTGQAYQVAYRLEDLDSAMTALDLRGTKLNRFPEKVLEHPQLQVLLLDGNDLTSLPPEITQLTNLTELGLGGNDLASLPPEIIHLNNLNTLDLGSNDLTSLPPEITQLTNLNTLHLGGNNLTSLPTEIGQLANLTTLDLWYNHLTSLPSQIGQLINLTMLDLRGNELTSLPPEITQLTNLTELDLGDNQLTSLPPEIGQLINLTDLDLRNNELTSLPPEITQLTNLTKLDLRGNDYLKLNSIYEAFSQYPKNIILTTDGDAENEDESELLIKIDPQKRLTSKIGQLNNLTSLDLRRNELTSLPPEIGQLNNLTTLNLRENELTSLPPEITRLTNLNTLDLRGNLITTLPSEIGQLVNLAELDMRNTIIPPEEYKKVKKLLPNCNIEYDSTSLELSGISSLPPEIGQLNNLTELVLYNNNQLTSLSPQIGQLTNLTRLDLRSNNRLMSLPPEIGQLTKLTKLYLLGSQLMSLPPQIGQLTFLRELHLQNNDLTSLPPEIGQLTKLEELDLEDNNLSQAERTRIRQLLPYCKIEF